jgi:diazepam-binding inhibitor (GABA receptor modulating acyl-CoA-binding protein)
MALAELFAQAQLEVKELTQRPANEELLDLYALFKQATEGDNETDQPGMFDIKEQFKWKQWNTKKGMSADEAMQAYVDLVASLKAKYS